MTVPDEPGLVPLSSHQALEVAGNDAAAFLQAQLTNDIESLHESRSTWSSWLTPKGRVIASFLLIRIERNRFIVIVPTQLAPGLIKRLRMYVFRSDVQIEDMDWTHQFVCGESIDDWFSENKLEPEHCFAQDGQLFVHLCNGTSSSALYILDMTGTAPETVTDPGVKEQREAQWNDYCISSASPWITAATSDQFIPQSLNLDAIGGLSFEKGCYPGQEIVARTHFKGRLKYRTAILSADQSVMFASGTKIERVSDTGRSGTVVIPGSGQALAVVPTGWMPAQVTHGLSRDEDNDNGDAVVVDTEFDAVFTMAEGMGDKEEVVSQNAPVRVFAPPYALPEK